jgi:hypothetical protein
MTDKQKQMLQQLWNLFGSIIGAVINFKIIYDYAIHDKEPSNMMVYIALLLYMQLFLKHNDKNKLS